MPSLCDVTMSQFGTIRTHFAAICPSGVTHWQNVKMRARRHKYFQQRQKYLKPILRDQKAYFPKRLTSKYTNLRASKFAVILQIILPKHEAVTLLEKLNFAFLHLFLSLFFRLVSPQIQSRIFVQSGIWLLTFRRILLLPHQRYYILNIPRKNYLHKHVREKLSFTQVPFCFNFRQRKRNYELAMLYVFRVSLFYLRAFEVPLFQVFFTELNYFCGQYTIFFDFVFVLLGRDAALLCKTLKTFWNRVSIPSSGVMN